MYTPVYTALSVCVVHALMGCPSGRLDQLKGLNLCSQVSFLDLCDFVKVFLRLQLKQPLGLLSNHLIITLRVLKKLYILVFSFLFL